MSPPQDNLESDLRRIPARHRRQVMDWSLVLVSQEIESSIVEDEQGWALLVDSSVYDRANDAINLYTKENRHWRWRQPLPVSGLIFHWGSALWCLCISWIFLWSEHHSAFLESTALMDNKAVATGEWWRVFTAITLHADLAHLAGNATTGMLLLGLAMARFGTGIGLMAAYLAGAGGNLVGYFIYDQAHRSLGASGMVMGALGLLAVQNFSGWRKYPLATRLAFRTIASAAFLFVLMGTNPNSDLIAHFGGFCCGILFGAILSVRKKSPSLIIDRICLVAVPLWVFFTWWMVFHFN